MDGRVGGCYGFGGVLLNLIDEWFKGGDKSLGDVGEMLQQVHNDPEVLQDRRFHASRSSSMRSSLWRSRCKRQPE